MRAFFRPYFLRSLTRASLVRKPAFFSAGRFSGSTRVSALVTPRRSAPACPVTPAADGSCDLARYRIGSNGAVFSPQGGLRISVADLAKVGGMLLRRGRLPDGRRFLREASLAEMERLHWRHDGSNGETEEGFYCAYGLAVQATAQCATDDLFGDRRPRIGHGGDAYGLRSGLWIDRASGRGIAFFATGLGDAPPKGRSSYRAVEEWLAANLTRRR